MSDLRRIHGELIKAESQQYKPSCRSRRAFSSDGCLPLETLATPVTNTGRVDPIRRNTHVLYDLWSNVNSLVLSIVTG